MRLRQKSMWYDFAYNLWYPAILGSMVYEIADVGSSIFAQPPYWFGLMIFAFYCLDYLFLYADVRRPVDQQSGLRIAFDIGVPVVYRVAFSLVVVPCYRGGVFAMWIAVVGLAWYLNRSRRERRYMVLIAVGLAAALILSLVLHIPANDVRFFSACMGVLLILYALYAVYLSERFVKRTES